MLFLPTCPINMSPILCRIYKCDIPQWFFEKYNETCVKVHPPEAEIADCNAAIETRLGSCGVIPVVWLFHLETKETNPWSIGPTVFGAKKEHGSGMMDVVITSLLQLDEGGNRSRRTTDVNGQLTFRPPLGQALEYRCFQPIGLRPHCQRYHLTMIASEFVPSAHGIA